MRVLNLILTTGLFFVALRPSPVAHAAKISVINVSLDQKIEAPRWMHDRNEKVKGPPLVMAMVEAKRALGAGERAKCLAALDRGFPLGKSLGAWLTHNYLLCAQVRDKSGKVSAPALSAAIAKVEANPRWLLTGPAMSGLRAGYVAALLALAESQTKTNRAAAWKTIDKLTQVRAWMAVDERASTYRWAGELAFIEQNLVAAQDFLSRSLGERENAEIRARIESIRSTLLKRKGGATPAPVPLQPKSDDVGISDDERDLAARMNRAYEAQDYVSAVEDGIELLRRYPGSRRALQAADMILDIYLAIANRTEDKFRNVRQSIVSQMQKADAGRLARWANNAYARGNYLDALSLAEKAYEKYGGQAEATKVLLLAAKAGVSAGEYDEAKQHFDRLIKFHGGTSEAAEGNFRLGLLEFRHKKYAQAVTYFERVLALSSGTDFEYRSMHWLWRAQQKIDAEKAKPHAEALWAKYPFSYYGLRAAAELNGNTVALESKTPVKPVKVELRMLESERLGWDRMLLLLKAGWFKEAEKEIEFLPDPQSLEERLLRAKLLSLSLRYDLAIQEVSRVIEADPTYARAPVLALVFPFEYRPAIEKESRSSGLSTGWIRALIRQESSFRPDVKSPANAHGLMQILPATGAELAKDLRIKDFKGAESLLEPDINIRIGSYYLARLLKRFNGNMPLALAAYNAGPTRLRRWLGARKDLSPIETAGSSSPEVEVWIDELPWDETSFYVKAVLRNWLIYQLLEGSKVTLSEPMWVDAKPPAR